MGADSARITATDFVTPPEFRGLTLSANEAGRVGGGTSATSFAWTNSHSKEPRAYHDLNVAGMKAHAALAEEFADQTLRGVIQWARYGEVFAYDEDAGVLSLDNPA